MPFIFLAWETLWRSVHADQRWKARQARLWRRMQRTLVNSFVQKSVHGFCTLVRMPARRTVVIHSFIQLKNKSLTNVWRSCVRLMSLLDFFLLLSFPAFHFLTEVPQGVYVQLKNRFLVMPVVAKTSLISKSTINMRDRD